MKLLTKEIQKGIPGLYSGQDQSLDERLVYVKYFAHWRWYATEACALCEDPENDEKSIYLELSQFYDVIDELDQPYATKDFGDVVVNDVIFFGLVEGFDDEWGYFALSELKSIRLQFGLGVERDLYTTLPAPMLKVRMT